MSYIACQGWQTDFYQAWLVINFQMIVLCEQNTRNLSFPYSVISLFHLQILEHCVNYYCLLNSILISLDFKKHSHLIFLLDGYFYPWTAALSQTWMVFLRVLILGLKCPTAHFLIEYFHYFLFRCLNFEEFQFIFSTTNFIKYCLLPQKFVLFLQNQIFLWKISILFHCPHLKDLKSSLSCFTDCENNLRRQIFSGSIFQFKKYFHIRSLNYIHNFHFL